MPLKFVSKPTLKWRKINTVTEDDEEVEIEVLCVCVEIENTDNVDKTAAITFRGYIPSSARPPGPDHEETLCEDLQVKVPKHRTVTKCCCSYTRTLIGIANWSGWLVASSPEISEQATTEHTPLTVPPTPKPN